MAHALTLVIISAYVLQMFHSDLSVLRFLFSHIKCFLTSQSRTIGNYFHFLNVLLTLGRMTEVANN